eukprot:TRINITY_DN8914_c0_g1_i2.p1 TRINITY_DN8914_c0_g1~~TRINITY_DN8914_c0_g1_i2.p1  ORF type:complete len:438 (+),score=118.29 TRINITY_DN8914_c0_g1_i2:106-1419(+)
MCIRDRPKWELGPKNWKMFGTSKFDADSKAVTLVDEDPKHEGRVWSRRNFKAGAWIMEFGLRVVGHGSEHDMGKGVGFWITERREKPGQLYGSEEKFKGVGVFFDTFDDDKLRDNPIIMAVQNDGTNQFAHDKDGSPNRFGGCRAKYRNRKSLVRVKLKWTPKIGEAGWGHLQMWLSMKDQGHFDVCFAKEKVRLNCGVNGTTCRIGFSSQNLPDAKLGDAVSVSGFRIWDLEEIERAAVRRQIAERERVIKRNEMHPDIQEMLGNYEYTSRNVGDLLMETLLEEVKRDRQSKHLEFVDLHEQLNQTLKVRGPVTKRDILDLIKSLKEVQTLSQTATGMLRELKGDLQPHLTGAAQGAALREAHADEHRKLTDMHTLKSATDRKQNKVARELREHSNSQATWGWLRYVLYFQVAGTVGLVFYKSSATASKPLKAHSV